MWVVVDRDAFTAAVKKAAAWVAGPAIPAVHGALVLSAQEGTLTIRAMDWVREGTWTLPAQVKTTGAVTVPQKGLNTVLNGAQAPTVTLSELDNRMAVTIGRKRAWVAITGDGTEYPTLLTQESPAQHEATVENLPWSDLPNRVLWAVAGGTTNQPALEHVWLRSREGHAEWVATDGLRVARWSWPAWTLPEHFAKVVPAPFLHAIAGLVPDGPVDLTVTPHVFRISTPTGSWQTRWVDLDYPAVDALLQIPVTDAWTFPADRWRETVQSVAPVGTDGVATDWHPDTWVWTARDGSAVEVTMDTPVSGPETERKVTWDGGVLVRLTKALSRAESILCGEKRLAQGRECYVWRDAADPEWDAITLPLRV